MYNHVHGCPPIYRALYTEMLKLVSASDFSMETIVNAYDNEKEFTENFLKDYVDEDATRIQRDALYALGKIYFQTKVCPNALCVCVCVCVCVC